MKKQAFTLLELLVVMMILVLLLSILMPSLIRAREEGRGICCRNNIRQMVLAAGLYTTDYDGSYPLSQYSWIGTSQPASVGNADEIIPSEPQEIRISYAWDFTLIRSAGQDQVVPGLLWQGQTLPQVNQCPSYKGDDNWLNAPFSGYNYNTSYIGHGEGERVHPSRYQGTVIAHPQIPYVQIVMPARVCDLKTPTQCVLFGDGQYANGANKLMRSPWYWEGDYDMMIRVGGTQGYRHNGKTNAGWCDGHVTTQDDLYTDSLASIQSQLDQYNRTHNVKIGFLSPDNRLYDLQ